MFQQKTLIQFTALEIKRFAQSNSLQQSNRILTHHVTRKPKPTDEIHTYIRTYVEYCVCVYVGRNINQWSLLRGPKHGSHKERCLVALFQSELQSLPLLHKFRQRAPLVKSNSKLPRSDITDRCWAYLCKS